MSPRSIPAIAVAGISVLLFMVLATANSGGYRFGVSDQAYYVPAIERQLDPALFPRDAVLIDAQSRLVSSDQLLAGLVRATGIDLATVAAVVYAISLLVLLAGATIFARSLHLSWWAVAAFGVLLTLRHRIAKTGANSLEGYMHPRQLAFGVGVLALAALVRGRLGVSGLLVLAAGVLHPTTALWFGSLLIVGVFVQRPEWRLKMAVPLVVLALVAAWMVSAGPLAGRLVTMDPDWLRVLAEKDYLFPTDWPVDAWLLNLAYPAVIVLAWSARRRLGLTVPGETAIVAGSLGLLLLFVASVPLTMLRVALVVQLQVTRVFWVLDFLALAYVAWWLTRRPRLAMAAVLVLLVGSAARGYYLLEVLQPERRLMTVELPDNDWTDALRWLRTQPGDWHVLADPGHAWKYGISVRVGALRDTVLESVKDSAIAMYDRDIAMRVDARSRALVDFDRLTELRVRRLATDYEVDVLLVEAGYDLPFPVLHRNAGFVIYDLR